MNKENENSKNKNTAEDIIRRHIIFYGSVQGVGFRYDAYHKGEMEVQGAEGLIDELIIHLDNQRFIRINAMDVKTIPLGSERDFFER